MLEDADLASWTERVKEAAEAYEFRTFLLGTALLVLLGLASVVLISRRQSHGKEESALRWNKILRWIYPLAFGLLLLLLVLR